MPGPCSLPTGPRPEWENMNNTVCNLHMAGKNHCTPDFPVGDVETRHEWVTLRVWLFNRKRLNTGKTK